MSVQHNGAQSGRLFDAPATHMLVKRLVARRYHNTEQRARGHGTAYALSQSHTSPAVPTLSVNYSARWLRSTRELHAVADAV